MKVDEKLYKYLDKAGEQKKLWHMKVTTILIVVGALETITTTGKKSQWPGD